MKAVILSAAKDLSLRKRRSYAALRGCEEIAKPRHPILLSRPGQAEACPHSGLDRRFYPMRGRASACPALLRRRISERGPPVRSRWTSSSGDRCGATLQSSDQRSADCGPEVRSPLSFRVFTASQDDGNEAANLL